MRPGSVPPPPLIPTGDSVATPQGWFSGGIVPTPVSRRYKAAMAVVAVAMVLLPLLYVGLIAAVAWAVQWHAVHDLSWLEGGGFLRVLLYGAPLVIGIILLLFLVKPLFARPREPQGRITLTHEEQPELFRFIGEICRLVHAPPPARVDVDCQVNASAGFRAGFASVFQNDLVLTIGLPLVAGMSARQLAGILAHEFGHFAQGGGMRVSFTVRSLNAWFSRVVYERDSLDLQLEEGAREGDFRIALILHVARGAVWLSRRFLWLLMVSGHALSCLLMRQMEFDADSYEAKVAGSQTFAETARRLGHLGAGLQVAAARLAVHWKERRLPDDLPGFIRHQASHLGPEVLERVDSAMDAAVTGSFDTHPAMPDRIRAAAALEEPGVCDRDGAAEELFRDFAGLCHRATRLHYATEYSLDVRDHNLVPVGELTAEGDARSDEYRALRSYAPGLDDLFRPVALDPASWVLPTVPAELHARIAAARSRILDASDRLLVSAQEQDRAIGEQERILVLEQLRAAKIRLKPSSTGDPAPDDETLVELRAHSEARAAAQALALDEAATWINDRLQAGLQLWWQDPPPEPDPVELRARQIEIETLSRTVSSLAVGAAALGRIRRAWQGLHTLFQNAEASRSPTALNEVTDQLRRELEVAVREISHPLVGLWYPFPHALGRRRITDLLTPEQPPASDLHRAYLQGAAALQILPPLYTRSLARLVTLALRGEGLGNLPDP